jgi:N-acetylglutamate synthase-like GNAT family acetyltransferase
MTMPSQRVRRATIEDLPKLMALWQQEQLPAEELGRRCLEFQIVESPEGDVLGAIGFRVEGQEGELRNEAFLQPQSADELRGRLWERLQTIIKNHGLSRVWTTMSAPFWRAQGFQPAPGETLNKLPTTFAGPSGDWHVLQFRRESAPQGLSLDQEFALFKEAEKESVARIYRQARVARMIAFVVGAIVLCLVLVWAVFFFKFHTNKP